MRSGLRFRGAWRFSLPGGADGRSDRLLRRSRPWQAIFSLWQPVPPGLAGLPLGAGMAYDAATQNSPKMTP